MRGVHLVSLIVTCGLLVLPARPSEAAEVCDEQGVCVDGAEWASGEQLDDAEREKQARRNRKRKDATLSVELSSGRGSVFLDGVWIAPAPIDFVPLKPGRHDLEIRDGETVLARGVLTIPRKGGDVTVRVGAQSSV